MFEHDGLVYILSDWCRKVFRGDIELKDVPKLTLYDMVKYWATNKRFDIYYEKDCDLRCKTYCSPVMEYKTNPPYDEEDFGDLFKDQKLEIPHGNLYIFPTGQYVSEGSDSNYGYDYEYFETKEDYIRAAVPF